MKFTDDPGACRLSFERVLDAFFHGPQEELIILAVANLFLRRPSAILVELVSITLRLKNGA